MTEQLRDPFQAPVYEISCGSGDRVSLDPIDKPLATRLADRIVKIDPWRTLGTDPTRLAASLAVGDHGSFRRAIMLNADCCGAIIIRSPWLYGPYLTLLAIFPEHQRAGVGSSILHWLESEIHGTANNIWACVSSFNTRAQSFYEVHGFKKVETLPDLVREGFSEILIRKQLNNAPES